MSPVNWAGSISEISPRRSLLRKKIRFLEMRSRAAPVTEMSDFATENSVLRMEIFLYEHSSLVDRDETFFGKIALLSQPSGRNA